MLDAEETNKVGQEIFDVMDGHKVNALDGVEIILMLLATYAGIVCTVSPPEMKEVLISAILKSADKKIRHSVAKANEMTHGKADA
jgi:hypothetical protein